MELRIAYELNGGVKYYANPNKNKLNKQLSLKAWVIKYRMLFNTIWPISNNYSTRHTCTGQL